MITVAHSPDTDDHFLFWAISEQRIDRHGLEFSFCQFDTQKLNEFALQGTFDVIAVSLAIYPQIEHEYSILPYGASVGRNYGPVVVARRPLALGELNSARVGVPGLTTTAALILSKAAPGASLHPYSIAPYNEGFEALEKEEIDALLLIHEGQIAYGNRNLTRVLDIGEWWQVETGLPLPLGINVIRRSLGPVNFASISKLIEESIRYGRDNLSEALPYLTRINVERGSDVTAEPEIRRYLDMYANDDSIALDASCWQAISLLTGGRKEVDLTEQTLGS